ncbi:MAG: 5-(carboxyamino)imidazole ribonucleotide mutase [Candidatus Gracilibacteria bacterium]|nr:5-(carboxyamino)imidazole ribonucleotide mutase [Candidatus Gracilibacteria bacterium]
MFIQFLLGSDTDHDFAGKITKVLDEFEVTYDIKVASAHKVPEKVIEIIKANNAKEEAICYITIAGRSNGLSGVTAGSAIHPVIACPPFQDKSDYAVNIHSTLQMPSDTPVLTVIDPVNAALCAARILALTDKDLKLKIEERIKNVKGKF